MTNTFDIKTPIIMKFQNQNRNKIKQQKGHQDLFLKSHSGRLTQT